MLICGLNKTTLLDYPEHVAATIFTGGCNFCCPFCHNGDLVLRPSTVAPYSEEEIFSFLQKRRSVLSGVCITGGEPTLQPDLREFILKVKALGLLVKLDTNGYRPDVFIPLCEEGLIDYVAMDIKNTPAKYAETAGVISFFDFSNIEKSVQYLLHGTIPCEFRTTVVKELHTFEDLSAIAVWLQGCSHYYIQSYKETEQIIAPGFSAYPNEILKGYVEQLQSILPVVSLRGID